MMPEFPPNIGRLPRHLDFVRDLEEFDGPILSEYHAKQGGLYLEKWCACHESTTRTLFVRTEPRAVAEYLARRMSMLTLLTGPSDGVGFVVDKVGDETKAVYMVRVADLPDKYLPRPTAFHDETLRPEWDMSPQSFLLDGQWDARLLAKIEKIYLEVYAFSLLTTPGNPQPLPEGVLQYYYDGGYSIMHAFNRLRSAVPDNQRAKAVGVYANSPGVLTIDAPSATSERLLAVLSDLRQGIGSYNALHEWSRLKPSKVDKLPASACTNVRDFCEFVRVDVHKLLPRGDDSSPSEVLAAGKLIAAYYRRLWRLLEPEAGVIFLGVKVEDMQPSFLDYEDDEGDDLGFD